MDFYFQIISSPLWLRRSELEAVNSLLCSAEVWNAWHRNLALPRFHSVVPKITENVGTTLSLTTRWDHRSLFLLCGSCHEHVTVLSIFKVQERRDPCCLYRFSFSLVSVWVLLKNCCKYFLVYLVICVKLSEINEKPVTVAERSKPCTVFARSEAVIVGSNPTQGMDVWCVWAFFCVCVVLCSGSGLATSWSPVQGVLPSVNDQATEISALCSKVGAKRKKKRIRRINQWESYRRFHRKSCNVSGVYSNSLIP
jgi:hypothetical protein